MSGEGLRVRQSRNEGEHIPIVFMDTLTHRSARKWLAYLLPPPDEESFVLRESGVCASPSVSPVAPVSSAIPSPPASPINTDSASSPPLRRLLDETSDLIESPIFTHVLTLLLDATFSQLTDQKLRTEAYRVQPLRSEPAARITDVSDDDPASASVKLATIMAVMTREAHKISNGVPNVYVQALESVSELEAFAAVVYSSNFELEASTSSGTAPVTDEPRGEAVLENEASSDELPSNIIIDKATGVVDAAWAGFETVWGKVVGNGIPSMTG